MDGGFLRINKMGECCFKRCGYHLQRVRLKMRPFTKEVIGLAFFFESPNMHHYNKVLN